MTYFDECSEQMNSLPPTLKTKYEASKESENLSLRTFSYQLFVRNNQNNKLGVRAIPKVHQARAQKASCESHQSGQYQHSALQFGQQTTKPVHRSNRPQGQSFGRAQQGAQRIHVQIRESFSSEQTQRHKTKSDGPASYKGPRAKNSSQYFLFLNELERVYTAAEPPMNKLRKLVAIEDESDDDGQIYCICRQPADGDMVACDSPNVNPFSLKSQCQGKWFHYACVGLMEAPQAPKWYCPMCKEKLQKLKNPTHY
eukprot:TRINITY_DN83_c0_g1_i1.p1 TRINITY_DN83_c0_g1~~TRINITY_DN83_c0_g1_i1.p1  ORF type:complete len:299 (-),score=-2.19 TRINITY_DN83_c0_g1_i1:135-899(-)